MLLYTLAVMAGFGLLIVGADRCVMGASATARNFGVSPLVIGLTIVGFGTSAPELLISAMAAFGGNPGLAIGNALGSNITNIALVLGVAALIAPLTVQSETLRREFPLLLAVSIFAFLLMNDGVLGRLDGVLMLVALAGMMYLVITLGLRAREADRDPMAQEFADEMPKPMSTSAALFWSVLGIVLLLSGSQVLVWGSVGIAEAFGVSDLIIGLTIVAIGTSMPELMATVVSALKREHDIALGNIIGSNMFNTLGVLGLPGVIFPSAFAPEVLTRDLPWMLGLTIGLFIMAYGFRGPGRLNRVEGGILLVAYIVYMLMLYWAATRV